MNEGIISLWNETVNPEDTVYILGDVAFMQGSEAAKYLRRMNGTKILIEGNHDHKQVKDQAFASCFESIHKYLEIYHDGTKVVLFHYPIHFEWNQAHRGSVHLYGHVHGKPTGLEDYRARDVGFDATGDIVTELGRIVSNAKQGKIPAHHN
jgi:calcineurin-like phosphoesterase family protein